MALFLLIAVMVMSGLAAGIDVMVRRRHRRILGVLCDQWAMRYSAADCLGMGARLQAAFPVPGASDLRVRDLVYRREADQYRYLLTIEYTRGVIGGKRRVRQVVTFVEPCNAASGQTPATMELAPDNLPIVQQYQFLIDKEFAAGSAAPAQK